MPSREALLEAAVVGLAWALIEDDTDVSDRGVSPEHYAERVEDARRMLPGLIGVSDEMVEAGARASAIYQDYDGCFERLDAWAALEQWERDAHPEEEPTGDAEDAQWWRDRVRVALTAALTDRENGDDS